MSVSAASLPSYSPATATDRLSLTLFLAAALLMQGYEAYRHLAMEEVPQRTADVMDMFLGKNSN